MKTKKHTASSVTPLFYKDVPAITGDASINQLTFALQNIADMCKEVIYVIDFLKQGFHYVVNRDFFLCDFSVEEVLSLGYDYFPIVIHPKDLALFAAMHATILQHAMITGNPDEILYYSFCVRTKTEIGYMMIYHKLKPVYINGQVRFGICMMSSSVVSKSGRLRVYYRKDQEYDEYISGEWRRKKAETLTMREQRVLIYARQGIVNKDMAVKMKIEYQSILNIEKSIYQKLGVKTMTQAIIYAINHHLVYQSDPLMSDKTFKHPLKRRPMTPEKQMRIQEKLTEGQSINAISKQENVSDFTIRYALKTGKLVREKFSI